MCCLPRYAKAAGVEPKAFTPEVPVYSSVQDVEPPPGATMEKKGWFARLNPFEGSEMGSSSTASSGESSDDSFWGNLWPF
jgi:hypothetical protein